MDKIYLDNAATTPIAPEVLEVMMPFLTEIYGNPSSIHSHGRQARTAIEQARKTVAKLLNCAPAEIFFTSGGTEADNTILIQAIQGKKIKHVISTALEHHAVLHTLQYLQKEGEISLHFVDTDAFGNVDLGHLEQLCGTYPSGFISLMHANNEVATIAPMAEIIGIAKKYNYLVHSDSVQAMGHLEYDLQALAIDFLAASAHKFHGPKGVGFMYIKNTSGIAPYLHGGAQERNMRGGTENLAGIVGLAKALELAYKNLEADKTYIISLKKRLRDGLTEAIPGLGFNGTSSQLYNSLFTVLNVSFPPSDKSDMLLFSLDINKISVSGGSACASGSDIGSHVLTALGVAADRPSVRFSFSKYNTEAEIDYVIKTVAEVLGKGL
jgi:cysteine desulfurase